MALFGLLVMVMADEADETAKANYATVHAMVAAYNNNPNDPLVMQPWMEHRLKDVKVFWMNSLLDSAAKPLMHKTNIAFPDATRDELEVTTGGSYKDFTSSSGSGTPTTLVMDFAAPIFGSGGRKIILKWSFSNHAEIHAEILSQFEFNDDHKIVAFIDYFAQPPPEVSGLLSVAGAQSSAVSTPVLAFGCGVILTTMAFVLSSRVVSGGQVTAAHRKLLDEVQA